MKPIKPISLFDIVQLRSLFKEGDVKAIEALSSKIDFDFSSSDCDDMFFYAASLGHLHLMDFLVSKNAPHSQKGITRCFKVANEHGEIPVLKKLISLSYMPSLDGQRQCLAVAFVGNDDEAADVLLNHFDKAFDDDFLLKFLEQVDVKNGRYAKISKLLPLLKSHIINSSVRNRLIDSLKFIDVDYKTLSHLLGPEVSDRLYLQKVEAELPHRQSGLTRGTS